MKNKLSAATLLTLAVSITFAGNATQKDFAEAINLSYLVADLFVSDSGIIFITGDRCDSELNSTGAQTTQPCKTSLIQSTTRELESINTEGMDFLPSPKPFRI